ncbi:MAG: class I SAM-dependent methyltransferase [Woeseiaceae bacterium]
MTIRHFGLATILQKLRNTPLHPQWFAFRRSRRNLRRSCESLSGLVLDIGCAESKPRHYLGRDAEYVGLDYFDTATGWYKTRPEIFGDAQQLPLASGVVDHVLLLDVLEHLPHPEQCLAEIHRVLKPGGTVTIQVPFLYPLHDAPLDFHRWTRFGLQIAAKRAGFVISSDEAVGHPVETAALITNIAASKTVLNWVAGRNPLSLLAILLPLFVVSVNGLAWLTAVFSRAEDMMPHAYRMVWSKT